MIGSRDYIPHPRFGSGPRYTGLDPDPATDEVVVNWNTVIPSSVDAELAGEWRGVAIPGTAIRAHHWKNSEAPQLTHYFDLERRCHDCLRWFIFYAEEQRFWNEKAGLPLFVDCTRCTKCRRERRHLRHERARYEELATRADLDREEAFELARCALTLVSTGVLGPRPLERVRQVLNRYPSDPESTSLRSGLEQVIEAGLPRPRSIVGPMFSPSWGRNLWVPWKDWSSVFDQLGSALDSRPAASKHLLAFAARRRSRSADIEFVFTKLIYKIVDPREWEVADHRTTEEISGFIFRKDKKHVDLTTEEVTAFETWLSSQREISEHVVLGPYSSLELLEQIKAGRGEFPECELPSRTWTS